MPYHKLGFSKLQKPFNGNYVLIVYIACKSNHEEDDNGKENDIRSTAESIIVKWIQFNTIEDAIKGFTISSYTYKI